MIPRDFLGLTQSRKAAKKRKLPSCLRAFVPSCEIFGALLLTCVASHAQIALPQPGQPAPSPTPQLAPLAPPVYVFPYPTWMVVTTGIVALLVFATLVWGIAHWVRNRPQPPPPTPRERALTALARLRDGMAGTEPYPLSIAVSDVLRSFVSEAFHVRATQQTSPEFLAAAAASPRFSEADKTLLAAFLEKADLIKFARVAASTADSEQLMEEALRFVEGGAAR